ncbi:hypothetical protein H4R26_005955 [Coemansia thaxteri]|uniref:Uncharacterized protein n=1 Tax=Coemansia thaxteri TaxID=2663907 RepID=A0A9W8B7R1_9FUNG|nr:hypothetical protein H4R26_005955 [Coemansia thaxteri]KAJ2473372.1 hypothetical protein EV174_005719 [Coemansia sp. RSA 2320]
MKFRLQKTAPAKAAATLKGAAKLPQLSVGPPPITGLVSPPSATPKRNHRPPPMNFGGNKTLEAAGLDLLPPPSPSMPLTPGMGGFGMANASIGCMLFGEASPSALLSQPTPPTASWAPKFFVTPPSPAIVAVPALQQATVAGLSASSSLSPCTPPWPKSGASLRKTIFDHIGKSQLSPMDMRGYMAMSMNS